jgi:peroxiredoxin
VCGISVDSIWAHAAWRQVLDLPDELLLLSDFNREFGERYGLLKDASGLKGILSREVLAIDRGGTIFYRWEPPAPRQLPKPDDVLAALRAHQSRG